VGKFTPFEPLEPLKLVGKAAPIGRDHPNAFDFVLGPLPGYREGCFAARSVHLIQGSSAAGKTTFGIQMLLAQKAGQSFMERDTFGKSFLVVMGDRGRVNLSEPLTV
jgi:hypothetical protein